MQMLENLCRECNNWFRIRDDADGIHSGTYEIEGGSISLPFLASGQYYRIIGSVFNDGLHCYGDAEDVLTDETFEGTIWALAIPKAFLALAQEVDEWQTANGNAGPYTSESFGGYSYTRATSSTTGAAATWADVFAGRLNQWRRIGGIV